MYVYFECLDRYHFDHRLERLDSDGVSVGPALINIMQIDCMYRTKIKGATRDVFLIVYRFKNDTTWSYCHKFYSEYKRDEVFNRYRRKLIRRKSSIKLK